MNRRHIARLCLLLCFACLLGSANAQSAWLIDWRKHNPVWRGAHFLVSTDEDLSAITAKLPGLTRNGINVIIAELDYNFQFKSRPEMNQGGGVTKAGARRFEQKCRAVGVRPIPGMNCLGHQSWSGTTFSMLTAHPQLDETPGKYPNNAGIYCRSWCPRHPDLPGILYPVIDEIADAFEADAFHVGMDEVFIIADPDCPRCKRIAPANLFARQVIDLRKHVVKDKGMEMLMWGDRLLDGSTTGYGEWEASMNNTFPAIDAIPKDIIVCDWHYGTRGEYPSLASLTAKGFRVWPCGWNDATATSALANQAKAMNNKKILGHLCSTWGSVTASQFLTWPPFKKAMTIWK